MAWAPDYCDVGELRAYRRIDDAVDDTELGLAITAASRAVDRATDRQFGLLAAAEARTYECSWSQRQGLWVAEIDDLMTTAALVVTVSGATVASTAYRLLPRNADKNSRPWTQLAVASATPDPLGSGPPTVDVTAKYGWTTVPDTIKNATLLQASRLFADRNAPFGVAGSPDMGNEMRLLAKVHPDVEVMLASYRRYGSYVG
jgi:hypothetical protein